MADLAGHEAGSDQVFLQALTALAGDGGAHCLDRLVPEWRSRLRARARPESVAEAASSLRMKHEAEARPDLADCHPTWWARALQDESDAVRRAVAMNAPDAIRGPLLQAMDLEESDLRAHRPPHPEVVAWASVLWSERLLGGPPVDGDDAPVIIALSTLDGPTRLELVSLLGLAKCAFLPVNEITVGPDPAEPPRLEHFRSLWVEADPRLVHVARLDVGIDCGQAIDHAQVGLITVGRLLAACEAQRARWALQHLPYNAAKYLRWRMSQRSAVLPEALLYDWESRIFDAGRERQRAEADAGRSAP